MPRSAARLLSVMACMGVVACMQPRSAHAADGEKAIPIPGTSATIRFGGYAKVDFIQDLDPVGNLFEFKLSSIPVDGTAASGQGGQTTIHAKESRINLDFHSGETPDPARVFVEGDFFGSGNGGFRLRHAYGEWRGFLGGQTWTTFMDLSARPLTLDFEGPDAEVFSRQPMIRYTGHPSERIQWAIAVESPTSEVSSTGPVAGSGRSRVPDVPVHVRFQSGRNHLQLAGILRQIRFVSTDATVDETVMGYGVNVSGALGLGSRDLLQGMGAVGEGIAHYIEAFSGLGLDAVLTPAGDLEALEATSAVVGVTHHWTANWSSTLSGALASVDNDPSQPGSAVEQVRSVHANLIHSPTPHVDLGGEFMWGEREDEDGGTGDAVRLQFSMKYKIN